MKKTWNEAGIEVLDMKETAHGTFNTEVEDSHKWTCHATPQNPCDAGHTKPGIHGTWGTENASL